MRNRLLSLLLTAVLLLGLLPGAGGRAVAAESPVRPGLLPPRLKMPASARAGQTVTITLTVDASGEGGICCGTLTLKGPDEQSVELMLRRTGPGELAANWLIDPHAAPGTWQVTQVYLTTDSWRPSYFNYTRHAKYVIKVAASGKPVDEAGPELVALSAPETAVVGEPYRIRVEATDDLSGVDWVKLRIAPDAESGADWEYVLELHPGEEPDTYTAAMVMEPPRHGERALIVTDVAIGDRAGNVSSWDSAALAKAGLKAETSPVAREVPEGLLTSPHLEVIHPGKLTYADWLATDRTYLQDQVMAILEDPVAVQERMLAELPQLRAALDDLHQEVYTDPQTGLRAVPFATTGKWMVLERALALRTLVMAVAGLPAEYRSKEVVLWAEGYLNQLYELLGKDETLLTMEGEAAAVYAQVAAAYLHALGQSPEAVAALNTPGFHPNNIALVTDWDPNLIYFVPVRRSEQYPHYMGLARLQIPAEVPGPMTQQLTSLLYRVGLHVGEAYLSHPDDEQRDARWAPYAALRMPEGWQGGEGAGGPATQLALDFVRAFAPYGLGAQFSLEQPIPPLDEDPEVAAAFREWVQALLAEPPGRPEVSRTGFVQVGTADQFRVEVRGDHPEAKLELMNEAWVAEPVYESISAKPHPERLIFIGPEAAVGRSYLYHLAVAGEGGRWDHRFFMYAQVPALLKPLPTATTEASITVTGTTLPNRVVRIGTAVTRSSGSGLFRLKVPLEEGANELRLTVQGLELGARFVVYRANPGEEAPLREVRRAPEITLTEKPVLVFAEEATIAGKVEYADSLTLNGEPVEVGPDGEFSVTIRLKPGERLEVELTATNRHGSATKRWPITRLK